MYIISRGTRTLLNGYFIVSRLFLLCFCIPCLPWLATVWIFPLELRENLRDWSLFPTTRKLWLWYPGVSQRVLFAFTSIYSPKQWGWYLTSSILGLLWGPSEVIQNGIWKFKNFTKKYFFYYWQRWFINHDKDLLLVNNKAFFLCCQFCFQLGDLFILLSSEEAIITMKCVKYHQKAQFITWPDSVASRLMHCFSKCYLGSKILKGCGFPETGGNLDMTDTLQALFIMTCN